MSVLNTLQCMECHVMFSIRLLGMAAHGIDAQKLTTHSIREQYMLILCFLSHIFSSFKSLWSVRADFDNP
jgi:hypothetical protein